jgi:hypothetical protein
VKKKIRNKKYEEGAAIMKKVWPIIGLLLVYWSASLPVLGRDLKQLTISGFASQGYLWSSENNYLGNSKGGSFEFSEVGISFLTPLSENLHFGIQFFAWDLGEVGNNKVVLDWAFGDYRWKDWLGIRLGKVRTPFMLYNDTRQLDLTRTSILLPQSIYDAQFRDVFVAINGGSLYGNIRLQSLGSLDWDLYGGTDNIDNQEGFLPGTLNWRGIGSTEISFKYAWGARLSWNMPPRGLCIGGSVLRTQLDINGKLTAEMAYYLSRVLSTPIPAGLPISTAMEVFYRGFSLEYDVENFTFSAEWYRRKTEMPLEQPFLPGIDETAEGYYLMFTYRLTDWLRVGSYYSVYYLDKDDKKGTKMPMLGREDFDAWQKDLVFLTRFDLNDSWLLKLEGHIIDGAAQVNSWENPGGESRRWFLLAIKVSFSF